MNRPPHAYKLDLAAFTGPLGSPLDIPPAKAPTVRQIAEARAIRERLAAGEAPKEIDPYRWFSVEDLVEGAR